MTVSKQFLRFLGIWLVVVILATVNLTLYFGNVRYQKSYDSKLVVLQNQIQQKQTQTAHNSDKRVQEARAEDTAPTEEQQKVIDYLNSGQNIEDNSVSESANCDAFKKPWRKFTSSTDCAFKLTKAVGDLKVLIVQFASPDLDLKNESIQKFISTIDSPQSVVVQDNKFQTRMLSFNYIADFYQAEAKKFGTNLTLKIDKTNLIQLSEYPPYEAKTRKQQLGEINKSQTFFFNELRKAKVDVRDYDAISIAVYSPAFNEFVSFALPGIRTNVTKVDASSWSTNSSVAIMAHELGHDFGAWDQYIEGTFNCQSGTEDQYTGDGKVSLMCKDPNIDMESSYRAVINTRAAKEMGWIQ